MDTVFLSGEYLPRSEARVSVDDRGFVLADGVYEVSPAYRGTFFRMNRHLARLRKGLHELRIDFDPSRLVPVHERLLEENGLVDSQVSYVYIQVTRGVAPRTHYFPPDPVEPTVYAYANEYVRPSRELWEQGFSAVTQPDRRWARADIKSIALLPNVLALQAAVDAGATDTILVRDGVAIEGAHNNFFAVFGDTLVTHPATHQILHGVAREYVLELAAELGIPVELRPIAVEELTNATETFFTGTTTEVRPNVEVDGRLIGNGRVGPITRRLFDAFLAGVSDGAAQAGASR